MTALWLALVVPWAAGVVLVVLDGRRRAVGWLAVAALAANLAALVVLAADVLSGRAGRASTTGDWPAGVGITLRADALGVLFAALSSLARARRDGPRGARRRARARVPRPRRAARRRADRRVPHRRPVQLLRLLRAGDDRRLRPRDVRRRRAASSARALVFTTVNLLGTFVFLLSVAGVYHVTGTLDMAADRRRAWRDVDPNAAC